MYNKITILTKYIRNRIGLLLIAMCLVGCNSAGSPSNVPTLPESLSPGSTATVELCTTGGCDAPTLTPDAAHPDEIITPVVTASMPISDNRISLEDAKLAYDSGIATIVDVRSLDAYNIRHVKGAVNIPLAEIGARYKELDQSRWIILYCT